MEKSGISGLQNNHCVVASLRGESCMVIRRPDKSEENLSGQAQTGLEAFDS